MVLLLPWFLDAGGCWPVLADGDGWGIPGAGPKGPGGRVVDERDIGSLQPVDQVRGLGRRRDLGGGLFPARDVTGSCQSSVETRP